MQIASYWASMGFRIDKKEINKVDRELKRIETKLKKFNTGMMKNLKIKLDIDKFAIDQKKLNIALGNALDIASTRLIFQVNNFDINQARLNQQMSAAVARASRLASSRINPDVNVEDRLPRETIRRRDAVAAGGIGGLASRMYAPALAIGLGGYGIGQVNRMNQEVISAQLTTQAVVEAAGLTGQGPAAFDWLKMQANRIGFSYMDQAQEYNNFLSNALGAGMGMGQSQDIYLGFAEYSKAMGITPARQKLVMNALSQMQGKGVVSMEELRRQMAESMPGTMSVFAQAYQQMTGGNKQGQEAIAALLEAVPTGKVRSSEILPIVAEIMRQRAAPKLDVAMKTSQAEQARLRNQYADEAMIASRSGVESGFARLFRSFTVALKESEPVIVSLSKAFDELSKYVSFATLLPQSIRRALEGRDSWVADMIGESNVEMIRSFVDGMKDLGKEIKETLGFAIDGWKMIFDEFGDEMLAFVNGIKNVLLYTFKALNSFLSGNTTEGMNSLGAVRATLAGKSQAEIDAVGLGKKEMPTLSETFMGDKAVWQYTPPALMFDFVKGFYSDLFQKSKVGQTGISSAASMNPVEYADHMKQMALAKEADKQYQQSVKNDYNISVNIDAATLNNLDLQAQGKALADWFTSEIEKTQVHFPNPGS